MKNTINTPINLELFIIDLFHNLDFRLAWRKKHLLLTLQIILFADLALTQPYDVVWTGLVGASASGSTITSIASQGWGLSGGASTNILPAGTSGYVEVVAGQTTTNRFIGLSNINNGQNFGNINFAIYILDAGYFRVYENGSMQFESLPNNYITTDIFRVERTGTQITYKRNNTTFWTSILSSSTSLIVDVALYQPGASLVNVKTSFPPPGGGNTPPLVSITSPTSGSSFPLGAPVILNATASDPGGSVSNVQFYDGVSLLGQSNSSPYSMTTATLVVGTHSITAKATDNLGATTTSSPPVTITINSATCTDGVQNGSETGIDCGGTCQACGGVSGNAWSGNTTSVPVYRTGRVHIGQANTNIGTESAYGLYVIGGIKTDKMKVELSSSGAWADYIFKNDYHLMPIPELQSFIKKYHHLPGFPSESVLRQDGGYEIGDMIEKQQAGIEILYLYIIELQKSNEKLEALERKLKTLQMKLNKRSNN